MGFLIDHLNERGICESAFSGTESTKQAMTPVLNCLNFQFTISVNVRVFRMREGQKREENLR